MLKSVLLVTADIVIGFSANAVLAESNAPATANDRRKRSTLSECERIAGISPKPGDHGICGTKLCAARIS